MFVQDLHRQLQQLQEHLNNIESQHSQRIMDLTATQRNELGTTCISLTIQYSDKASHRTIPNLLVII